MKLARSGQARAGAKVKFYKCLFEADRDTVVTLEHH